MVAEAMRKQQATFQSAALIGQGIGKEVGKEIAKQIGQDVDEHITAALQTAMLNLQQPAFDVREQIISIYWTCSPCFAERRTC